ncbi:MAG: acyloxyacyl hydrolase [Ignavibacteriales bacterium]|nr:acyloxyacyl hydrolase [Ignavibacteriales bacterium]
MTESFTNNFLCKKNKILAFILLTLFLNFNKLHSQDLISDDDHKIGFQFGYGTQDLLSVDYYYIVYLLQVQYFYSILSNEEWSVEITAQPQFNLTLYKQIDFSNSIEDGYEMGLNFGIVVRKNFFNDLLWLYLLVGTGPHYTSGTPDRQASGFIFSDNFFIGLNFRIVDNFHLDLRTGIRHISNADLEEPNSGLNNFIIDSGFFITF